MFKNWFKRSTKDQSSSITHKKSSGSYQAESLGEILLKRKSFRLAAHIAIDYYSCVSPVAIGISKIATELKSIKPKLFDTNERQFLSNDNEIVDFLSKPNRLMTWESFIETWGSLYIMTGNTGLVLLGGKTDKEPNQLYLAHPATFSPQSVSNIGPLSYEVASSSCGPIAGRYKLDEQFSKESRSLRYFTENKRLEFWHSKSFSPKSNFCEWGASKLQPAWLDIEQYFCSQNHNLSTLEHGARPSGILTFDDSNFEEKPQDLVDILRQEIEDHAKGAANAGKPLILPFGKWQEASISNKDMDFLQLKKDAANNIYNIIGIPLPLVTSDASTFNNVSTAQAMMYQSGVIPLANSLFSDLTHFLVPRFKEFKDKSVIITYDPQDIEALSPIRIDNMLKLQKSNVMSDNELRSTIGREPYEGGDVIYKAANLMPVGNDSFTDDEPLPPKKSNIDEILRGQKDSEGNSLYSDQQIKSMIDQLK